MHSERRARSAYGWAPVPRPTSPLRSTRLPATACTALLALALCSCSNELYLAGDSYVGIMAPYVATHTGCPTYDYTVSGRTAAEVLVEDVDAIADRVATLEPGVRPVVILSAGAVDESLWGPEITGVIVTELGKELLAIDPRLELFHLDYGVESASVPVGFWDWVPYDENPRWHRVQFPQLVDGEISGDGIHLPLPGYVERLLDLVMQHPTIVCNHALEL